MNDILALDTIETVAFNSLQPVLTGLNATVREAAGRQVVWTGYTFHNNDATARWVQVFYKPEEDVELGVTAPDFTVLLGASASVSEQFQFPIRSGTGLSLAGTTTETGTTGATAAATGQVFIRRPV